jgi:hypothetical protein
MNIKKPSRQNIGNAGEYFMAHILSSYNFVVTVTLGRNEKYDLLAVNPEGKTTKISVKTLYDGRGFMLSEKDEKIKYYDLYYAFINLKGLKNSPDFWIVPSNVVSRYITNSHKKWLIKPNRKGGKNKNTPRRVFRCERESEFKPNLNPLIKFSG